MAASPWILAPTKQASLHTKNRLFCLPYAGGGASIYRTWAHYLPPEVEVCPIQLPGREGRFSEQPYKRIEPLIQDLIPVLLPYLDRPFQIFGHSMGALITLQLVRELRRQGLQQPTQLFASARPAPQLPRRRKLLYTQPDDEFKDTLKTLGGTPEAVLQNAELMELFLPLIRADFELVETFSYQEEAPLAIPIASFGSNDDPDVNAEEVSAWKTQTSRTFSSKMFPGGHFYLHSHQELLLATIKQYYSL